MTAFIRKILFLIIGIIGGLSAWTMIEAFLFFRAGGSSYLLFTVLIGANMGGLFGFYFGTIEGIAVNDSPRSLAGGLNGALVGIAGGILSFLAAQGLLFLIMNASEVSVAQLYSRYLPATRTAGWAVIGLSIGVAEGIRSRSGKRALIGVTGGLIGGFAGGLALEYLMATLSSPVIGRGAGLVCLGAAIGIAFSLVEQNRSHGKLKVLTGSKRGKEFLITRRRTSIGSGPKSDILLPAEEGLSALHAHLVLRDGEVHLEPVKDGICKVNEQQVSSQALKYEDVLEIGKARLFYLP